MRYANLVTAGVVAASALATCMAFASPPAECMTGPGSRSYESAYKTHKRFLKNLFESTYGCSALEVFSEKVDALTRALATTDACRESGYRDAAIDAIDEVTHQCLGGGGGEPTPAAVPTGPSSGLRVAPAPTCEQNGREQGRLSAELYCAPPCTSGECLPLGAPTLPLCDLLAAQYCRQAFRRYVNMHPECRVRSLSDTHFNEAVEAACAPAE